MISRILKHGSASPGSPHPCNKQPFYTAFYLQIYCAMLDISIGCKPHIKIIHIVFSGRKPSKTH
jgi:hypothetical protein